MGTDYLHDGCMFPQEQGRNSSSFPRVKHAGTSRGSFIYTAPAAAWPSQAVPGHIPPSHALTHA